MSFIVATYAGIRVCRCGPLIEGKCARCSPQGLGPCVLDTVNFVVAATDDMSFSLGQGLTRVVTKVQVPKGPLTFTYFDTPGLDDAEQRIETAKSVRATTCTNSLQIAEILLNKRQSSW